LTLFSDLQGKRELLKFIVKLGAAFVGIMCIGLLVQHSLELHLEGRGSFEHVVEQTGLNIVCGVIVGLILPMTTRRRLLVTILAMAGALALGHILTMQSDVRPASILVDWIGACLGLLVVVGLLRSWDAMYGKHLVPWGGPARDS
jgi:hypothetical protein